MTGDQSVTKVAAAIPAATLLAYAQASPTSALYVAKLVARVAKGGAIEDALAAHHGPLRRRGGWTDSA